MQSADSCRELATSASPGDKAALELRAARLELWRCRDPGADGCTKAAAAVWRRSPDPAEITMALGLLQRACNPGVPDACRVARAASWYGRGTSVDAAASVGWHRACGPGCPAFDPLEDRIGVEGFAAEPWAKLDPAAVTERAREIAAAGHHDLVLDLARTENAAGLLPEELARTLMESSAAARWTAEVEPLLAGGPTLQALAAADAIVKAAPVAGITSRRDRIRADLAARELAAMTQARDHTLPFATRLHARLAALAGATVDVPPEPTIQRTGDVPSQGTLTNLPASCELLREPAADTHATADALAVDAGGLTCTRTDRPETHTERTVVGEETYEVSERVEDGEECKTYDDVVCTSSDGQCYRHTRCSPRYKTVRTTKTRPRYAYHEVTTTITKLAVQGSLQSPLGNGSIDFHGEDRTSRVRDDAAGAVAKEIERILADARARAKAEAITRERQLAAAASGLEAEDHLLRAFALGDVKNGVAKRLGLEDDQLRDLLHTGAYQPAPRPTPSAVAAVATAASTFEASRYPEPTRDAAKEEAAVDRKIERLRGIRVGLAYASRTDAMGGADPSTGYGVRLERAFRIPDEVGKAWSVEVAGGSDSIYGAYFDARVAFGLGLRNRRFQALYTGGLGVGGLGQSATDPALATDVDLLHGPYLELYLDKLTLDARYWWLYGGPLGGESRLTAAAMVQLGDYSQLGVETVRRSFDGRDIVSYAITYRIPWASW